MPTQRHREFTTEADDDNNADRCTVEIHGFTVDVNRSDGGDTGVVDGERADHPCPGPA